MDKIEEEKLVEQMENLKINDFNQVKAEDKRIVNEDIVEDNGDKIIGDFNIIINEDNNFEFTLTDKKLKRFFQNHLVLFELLRYNHWY